MVQRDVVSLVRVAVATYPGADHRGSVVRLVAPLMEEGYMTKLEWKDMANLSISQMLDEYNGLVNKLLTEYEVSGRERAGFRDRSDAEMSLTRIRSSYTARVNAEKEEARNPAPSATIVETPTKEDVVQTHTHTTTTKKAAKTAKKEKDGTARGRGRAPRSDLEEMTIKVLVDENPKKRSAAERFAIYKDGMRVADYIKKVGNRALALADVNWDSKHKWIKLHQ